MGLGCSKEEEPPDDAAPGAGRDAPAAGITSDEEEAVQVRKAARARRVKGITGSPGVHSFHSRGGDTPSRRQELARRVQEHHDAVLDTDATMFDASQQDVGVRDHRRALHAADDLDEYEEELDGEEYKSSGTSSSLI